MHKSIKLLVLPLLCLILCLPVRASHVMGTDLNWENLGKDSFRITVTAYRDCNGIDMAGGGIEIWPTSNPNKKKNLGGNLSPALDITPVCSKMCSKCSDRTCTFAFGYQKYEITAFVKLDSNECEWTLSWQQCCRNAAITTGASGANFYTEASFNSCVQPYDNSPKFKSYPIMIVQKNLCQVLDFGAHDVDMDSLGRRDSLVYKFGDPLQGSKTPIPYGIGYGKNYPLVYSGNLNDNFSNGCKGFHLNSLTGEVSFKPAKEEVSVFVIIVEEWRKDSSGKAIKIGETRRDIQVIVAEMPANQEPSLSATESKITIVSAIGQERCVTISSQDPDTNDVLLTWINKVPGATFTVLDSGTKSPKVKMCWKPKANDTLNNYFVTFYVQDDACPLPSRILKTIMFKTVRPPKIKATATVNCGVIKLEAQELSGKYQDSMLYTWTGTVPKVFDDTVTKVQQTGNPVYLPYSGVGFYRYTLTARMKSTGVEAIIEDSVYVSSFIRVKLPLDSIVCQDYVVPVKPQILSPAGVVMYKWYAGGKNTLWKLIDSGATKNVLSYKAIQETAIKVVITDSAGCTDTDSFNVFIKKKFTVHLGKDVNSCVTGTSIQLDAGHPRGSHRWAHTTDTNRIIQVNKAGSYVAFVRYGLCEYSDTVKVSYGAIKPNLGEDQSICAGDTLMLDAGYTGGTHRWLNTASDTGQYLAVTTAGSYISEVTYGSCTGFDTINISVDSLPLPALGKDTTICDTCQLILSPGLFSSYLWSTGETTSAISVADSGSYWVTVVNIAGCAGTDTINVKEFRTSSVGSFNIPSASIRIQPNPFGQSTSIVLNSTATGPIQLEVYDVLGRKVRTVGEGVYSAGEHRFTFDAAGETGSIFLLRATVNGYVQTFRMVRY